MSSRPPVKLSALRDIGWREWDPIGLSTADGWEGSNAADEYDGYLLHIASRLQDGQGDDELIGYLVRMETEHMGLTPSITARRRAAATIAAMREYVSDLF